MTGAPTPYRSGLRSGHDGFVPLLRAEWTKFRTVRGWVVGVVAAALVTVLLGLLTAAGSHTSCGGGPADSGGPSGSVGPSRSGAPCRHTLLLGPGGEAVTDNFYFVHQPLGTKGSITVRVTSLTGLIPASSRVPAGQDPMANMRSGVEPWTKAGLIVKQSTKQGSAYAAIMMTGSHGVRMQYDYTHDTAGRGGGVSATSPRWLRLTRSGATLTGYESTDGANWTKVGTATLAGLSSTVTAGLFVASPDFAITDQHLGGSSTNGGPTHATATFDNVSLGGQSPTGRWQGDAIGGKGGGPDPTFAEGFQESSGRFVLDGAGDIAPALPGGPGFDPVERSLVGAFAGLIVLIVVGTMYITAEYRRGLIRTTFAATPRRSRVLAAKAIVIGSVTFAASLAAAVIAWSVVGHMRRNNGDAILPVTSLTAIRVVVGTAALLAVAAVLALAVGTVLRRSAGAVTAVIVLILLPYILAVASVLPADPAQWLLRITPAAGFAIQQSIPQYTQVSQAYTLSSGYFPLTPWAGFAVLCGYAALAMGLAVFQLQRRDA